MFRKLKVYVATIFFFFIMNIGSLYAGPHVLHPKIHVKDASGVKTCAPCHDTTYINKHNMHFNARLQANCYVCHLQGSELKVHSDLHVLIQLPTNDNCAYCHGLTSSCRESLQIPNDYLLKYKWDSKDINVKNYSITQNTGVVIAPSNISASKLNMKNKRLLNFPWDIHSRRQITCISCHYTRNDPRSINKHKSDLDHLIHDPRRLKPPNEYLKWPDHNLKSASCRSCHNPFVVHDHLPFKERHMEKVACQSCHVPQVYGPAFRVVDTTVSTQSGSPRIELRGVKTQKVDQYINTQLLTGFQPYLFPEVKKEKDGKIYPYNIKTEYFWLDKATGKIVDHSVVKKMFLVNNKYTPKVLQLFDKNKDNTLTQQELVIDTKEKYLYILSELKRVGILNPVISSRVSFHKINHGVRSIKNFKRNCYMCHSTKSNFKTNILLAQYIPYKSKLKNPKAGLDINGSILSKSNSTFLTRDRDFKSLYMLGQARNDSLKTLGFIFFILSLTGVFIHAALRIRYASELIDERKNAPKVETESVYMYAGYERFWHWTMALSIVLLILTGIEIHFAGSVIIFGLENTVVIHNVLATIMVVNALLSLFYHITTGEIKQFFSFKKGFFRDTVEQASYYMSGIFTGKPHPIPKTVDRKLNPLQQFTYVMILNVLLPIQVITGICMWAINNNPAFSKAIGGMMYIGPLHNFGSWLIMSFLVVHVYLTTTGYKPMTNIVAMITGFEKVPKDHVH